jgi:hypothetical protein
MDAPELAHPGAEQLGEERRLRARTSRRCSTSPTVTASVITQNDFVSSRAKKTKAPHAHADRAESG